MGRPKKYTDEYIDKLSTKLLKWCEVDENIWLKDFAIEQGFSSQRLSEFAKSNEQFSETLKRAKDIQESKLVKQGLDGKAIAFVIFALKNVAGWRDLPEQKQQEGLKPIPYEIIEDNKNTEPNNNRPDTV